MSRTGQTEGPRKSALAQATEEPMVVDTVGERMPVRWDETAQAMSHGQVVFRLSLASNSLTEARSNPRE